MSIEPRAILSTLFIFLGAAVFYIASLVSGRNIFRDISQELAIFLSTIVGSILFLFSPISFMILAPDLFHISKDGIRAWQQVHQQILHHLLLPFVLSALGTGIIIGALGAADARSLVLDWIRKKTGVRYPILSYETTWDRYLGSLKRGATIRVLRDDKDVNSPEGKLRFHSIRGEPKEIVIECENGYRVIEAGDIACLSASSEAFNRHMDKVSHHVEAFYLMVAMLGFLSLAGSAELLGSYFLDALPQDFVNLAGLYHWLAAVLLACAIFMATISYRTSRADFHHAGAYFVLCPTVPFALLCGACVLACIGVAVFARWGAFDLPIGAIWTTTLLGGISVVFLYKWHKVHSIDRVADRIGMSSRDHRTLLFEVCQHIYMGTDLLHGKKTSWREMMNVEKDSGRRVALEEVCISLSKAIDHLIHTETFLWLRPRQYLADEELNIVLRLARLLEKERDKGPALQASRSGRTGKKNAV